MVTTPNGLESRSILVLETTHLPTRVWIMHIRPETDSDVKGIWNVHAEAFETHAEADLVNALRASNVSRISFVAEHQGKIVGHILFTAVEISGPVTTVKLMGLAPMSVSVDFQKQGIGSQLIKTGLAQCQAQGVDAVVVLGHPNYYPRFGFQPSVAYGIKSEYDVPDDVFMALELEERALHQCSGTIQFHETFSEL